MVKVRAEDEKSLRDFACLAFDCFGTLVDCDGNSEHWLCNSEA